MDERLLKAQLIKEIEEAGSSDLEFGGSWVGGYHIQQDPSEFADLILCLEANMRKAAKLRYLQVGSAAGGCERFIMEKLKMNSLTIIDDGKHFQFEWWNKVNRKKLQEQGFEISEHIGDSHEEAADEFLKKQGRKYDLIGIDGDHSACGARLDWLLVEPYIQEGTLIWLHDLHVQRVHDQGPWELWSKLKSKPNFEVRLETMKNFGIGLIQVK